MAEGLTDWVLGAGLVAIAAVSLWLSMIALREHRLPNRIVGPLAGGVALWLVVLGVASGDYARALVALGWGFAGFAVFFALHLTAGLGMGDVKYAWPVCATLGWFGWPSLRFAVLVVVLAGGLAGAWARAQGKGANHRHAYGRFMAFGLICGALWGLISS